MTARAAYDESYFYMAVDVMDDVLDADYGYGMYGGDCLQIAFSEYGDDYGAEYGFSNYNGQPEIWRWYDGNAALEMQSVQFKTVRDEETGHTRYEIAFPWQSIFAAKPDGSFYMTMLAGGYRKRQKSRRFCKGRAAGCEYRLVHCGSTAQCWRQLCNGGRLPREFLRSDCRISV